MANAKDKRDVLINLICERCDMIKAMTRDKYSRITQPNYGHVGDLTHISDELMELIMGCFSRGGSRNG